MVVGSGGQNGIWENGLRHLGWSRKRGRTCNKQIAEAEWQEQPTSGRPHTGTCPQFLFM